MPNALARPLLSAGAMSRIMAPLIIVLFSLSPSLASAEDGEPHRPFLHSALGPGPDDSVLGLGLRGFFIIPMADVMWMKNFGPSLDGGFRASTVGLFTSFETGVRYRVLGGSTAALAVRLNGMAMLMAMEDGGVSFGVLPGLFGSFGSSSFQVTLGVDVGRFIGAVQFDGSTEPGGYMVRPQLAVEFPLGERLNLYVQGEAWLVSWSEILLPVGSVGLSW